MDKGVIAVQLLEKMKKCQEVDKINKSVPFYKVLFKLMDEYASSCFYGNINIRMNGVEIKSLSYDNVNIRLEDKYEFDEE